MDVPGLGTIPVWMISVVCVIIMLYLYSKWKQSLWKNLGIPGPDPIPFVGITKSYFKKGSCVTDLELVKQYGDVVGVYQCNRPVLIVTDPDMIKEIFIKEFSKFSNRSLPVYIPKQRANSVAIASDTHWKFLRSTLSPTFTSGKLKLMMEKIHKCCRGLVDNIKSFNVNGKEIDMATICGGYTMDVISSTAFGIDVNSQKEPNNKFVYYAKKAAIGSLARPLVLLYMMFPFLKEWFPINMRRNKDVADFFGSVIKSAIKLRREGSKNFNDFLELMLNARSTKTKEEQTTKASDLQEYKNRGLNEMEIHDNSLLFFLAGYDTTANTLSFASYCLAVYPDVQEKVIAEVDSVLKGEKPQYETINEMQYLDMFLNEVLRLYGAAVSFNRECKESTKIKGVFIPKGTDVLVSIFALHRNPKYWPEPEKFDPERFTEENKAKRPEYSFLPFGIGPRICIGMRLALLEAKMALVYMVQNFTFSICDKTEIPVTFDKGIILRAVNGIHLKINRRER